MNGDAVKRSILVFAALTVGCSRARLNDTAVSTRLSRDSGGSLDSGDSHDGMGDPADEKSSCRVTINELMSNGSLEADWLELINLEPEPVDLSGWQLFDEGGIELGWPIPDDTVLEPGALLVVTADDGASADAQLSASFKLSSEGETLSLVDPQGALADEVEFPALELDTSYARLPDGTGSWVVSLSPTRAVTNVLD